MKRRTSLVSLVALVGFSLAAAYALAGVQFSPFSITHPRGLAVLVLPAHLLLEEAADAIRAKRDEGRGGELL